MGVPCDQCRRRRVRCTGLSPCDKCVRADLRCKYDYVPKRRGPKHGVGKVIAQLKSLEAEPDKNVGGDVNHNLSCSRVLGLGVSPPVSTAKAMSSPPRPSLSSFAFPPPTSPSFGNNVAPPPGPSTISAGSCDHISVLERCVDLFLEHIYPIKPVFNRPVLQALLTRQMEAHEMNMIYALCAMTATHMSGRPEYIDGQLSWISLGRFFLAKCAAARQAYDFIEDRTLFAIISSYFLFEAYFELDEQRKSWYYLQEATTLAQELGLHEEASYASLPFAEGVSRRRTFWLLFVSERAIAVFRHKPLKLSKVPGYPLEKHDYEGAEVQQSLMSLIHTFTPLDADFVNMWNQSDYDISNPGLKTSWSEKDLSTTHTDFAIFADSQKADVLVTQQWIRLIVWQCALRKGLLSSSATNPSMTFKYPLEIASSLINIISRIPKSSIMVHGLGIFEKIFDIACSVVDVASTRRLNLEARTPDYVGPNPFLAFMHILSFTPNSKKIFASALETKAADQPEILRSVFRSGLTMLVPDSLHTERLIEDEND